MEERQDPMDTQVSVVIAVKNGLPHIREAVASALNQRFDALEILIIDDGSTDGTVEAINAMPGTEKIRFIQLPVSVGPYAARNIGIEKATGRYIAFLDADDIWEPDKLMQQVEATGESETIGLVHTWCEKIDSNGKPFGKLNIDPEKFDGRCFERLLEMNGIATSSVLVPKAVFDRLGVFDERFQLRGDWEMWTRIARHYDIKCLDTFLVRYRMHEHNISTNRAKVERYHFQVLEKFEREYVLTTQTQRAALERGKYQAHMEFGIRAYIDRDMTRARHHLRQALRQHPFSWSALAGFAKTLLYPLTPRVFWP